MTRKQLADDLLRTPLQVQTLAGLHFYPRLKSNDPVNPRTVHIIGGIGHEYYVGKRNQVMDSQAQSYFGYVDYAR